MTATTGPAPVPVAASCWEGVQDLLAATGAPVTARPRWWDAWAQAFGAPRQPVVLRGPARTHRPGRAVAPGGEVGPVRAIAPLTSVRRGGRTEVGLLGGEHSDHARLSAATGHDARALADLVVARLEEVRGPWRLRLEHLPPGDPAAQRLAEVLPTAVWSTPADLASPCVRLDRGAEVGDYLGAASRKSRGKRERAFQRAGARVRTVRDRDEVAALLPALAGVRRARDHAAGRVSELDRPDALAFWRTAVLGHVGAGEAEVSLAEAGGAVLAYTVVLLDGPTHRLWDGRVAPSTDELSAGVVLQQLALERALAAGSGELDLMRGVTTAKMRLATDVVACSVLQAWSSPWRAAADRAAATGRAEARRARDASPALVGGWAALKGATVVRRARRSGLAP